MGQITDFVKANFTPAEGIELSEVEKLERELDPLSGLTTIDHALDFMGRNDLFSRALKKHETTAIEKHDEKFTTTKLPEILKAEREKIVKELNPEETPEQKRIRELEDREKQRDKSDAEKDLRIELQKKAKEIGYTRSIDLYMHLGDKAIETMVAEHTQNTEYLTAELDKLKKELYGNNPPPKNSEKEVPKDIDEQIRQARAEGNSSLALKLQMQKNTKQQQ
jgi:hypothetical protein